MRTTIKNFFAILFTACLLLSCDATRNANNKQKGAVIGATGGAVIGGVVGNNVGEGNTALGAIIGGVVGGAAGAYIGNRMDEQAKQIEEEIPGAEVERVGEGINVTFDETSGVFFDTEKYNINTITAESGQEAIDMLNENSNIDMVLMDIMMPEMDGYETTQKIRREHKNSNLPIIAVTAKAMKGDREKCIEAGASDYITKPVKIDQLLSLMRVWLYK